MDKQARTSYPLGRRRAAARDTACPGAPSEDDALTERPYQIAAYCSFWLARVFSAIGYQMVAVVVGWLVYEKTGSAYYLGLIGLCQFLPVLLLTFIVGHIVDRTDRRKVILICQSVEALALAAMAVFAYHDRLEIAAIFGTVFVIGCARAFETPSLSSLLPGLVPASMLHQAISLSSSAMQTATILGPALGGLLYGFGVVWPLAAASGAFLIAAVSMLTLEHEHVASKRETPTLASVFRGVHFIRSQPVILGTISLDLFAVLLGGVTSLLPIFARDVLETGPWGLGVLRSAPAIGALVMSLMVTHTLLKRSVGLKMFGAVMIFGAATIVFALSSNLILSFAALVALGGADNVSVVIRNSLVMLSTPDEMRGRVNSVNALFIGTSNQIGDFESGIVAGLVGAVPAGLIGGIGTIAIALLWMRMFPELRDLDVLPQARA